MDLLIRHSMYAVNVMSFNRSCPSTSVYLAYHRPKKVPMKGSFPSCFLVVAVWSFSLVKSLIMLGNLDGRGSLFLCFSVRGVRHSFWARHKGSETESGVAPFLELSTNVLCLKGA